MKRLRVFLPLLLIMVPFVSAGINYQPDILHEIAFDYDSANYWYVLQWKSWYIKIQPYAVYDGREYTLKQMVPFIKNQYPAVTYRQVVEKFAKYHRWGFWLEKLPPEISDKLDAVGYKLIDTNIPLGAFEVEHDPEMNVSRLNIGGKFTLDFSDLEARYDVSMDKQGIHVTGVRGLTDIDMDPITYSAPTITVTGTNAGAPWTFLDIYNADVAGGWGVVSNNNGTNYQFEFNAKIVIGVSGTPTTFTDTNKQIVFLNGIMTAAGQNFIEVKADATFTLGTLLSLAERRTKAGCDILILETTYRDCNIIRGSESNEKVYIYDTVIRDINANPSYALRLVGSNTNRNLRVINCNFVGSSGPYACFYEIIYYLRVASAKYGIINSYGNLLDRMVLETLFSWDIYTASNTYDMTVYNLESRQQADTAELWLQLSKSIYLVNCELFWDTLSIGYSVFTGSAYRQYTWNTLIKDNIGSPIQNANVTLIRADGTPAFTVLTYANGTIPEQTVTRGYYTQPTGNTLNDHGPFNLQIEAPGYLPHTIFNITLSEPINWEIAMSTIEIINEVNIELITLVITSIILSMGFYLGERLMPWFIAIIMGALSGILFLAAGFYWTVSDTTIPIYGWLWTLWGIINLILVTYFSIGLMRINQDAYPEDRDLYGDTV